MTEREDQHNRRFHHRMLHHAKHVHKHVKHHAWHLFVPHHGNDHRPHALRPRALRVYSVSLIAVKVFVSMFLFAVYPSNGEFAAITASEIISLTNSSRSAKGLQSLTLNSTLNRAASLKAQDMIANNYFAHTSPNGTKPWEFLKRAGYSYSAAGENLAMDFTEAGTVHTAFMNSPSHASNILSEKYTEMGVAVASGEIDGRQTTILVEFFGKPYVTATAQPTPAPTPQPTVTSPTPTPVVTTPAPAPVPVTYTAALANRSHESLAILTDEPVHVWVEFRNTGTATWTNTGANFIALNTTNPAGRESGFHDDTWRAAYRPAVLDQTRVSPGQTGRFSFTLEAPAVAGTYQEDFGLVAENLTWMAGGTVEFPITVVDRPQEETPTSVNVVAAAPETPPEQPESTPPTETPAEEPPQSETPVQQPESTPLPEEEVIAQAEVLGEQSSGFVGNLVDFSNRFFVIFLIFIVVALLLNILIEVRIQHPHLIFQSFLVLILTASALVYKPHFLEGVTRVLTIQ